MFDRKFVWVLLAASVITGCKDEAPKPDTKPAPSVVTSGSAAGREAKVDVKPEAMGTTFKKVALAVGDKREENMDMDMSMTMNIDAAGDGKSVHKMETKMTQAVTQTVEVLAATADAVTKLKVTFSKIDEKMTDDGKEKKKPSVIAGKTYVLESKAGKVDVQDDKGKPVSAAESKEAASHFKSLGKPDPIFAALPTTPIKAGDKVEPLAKGITERMAEGDGPKVSDVTVTFREQSGDDGIFDVGMKMTKEQMVMDMKGETRISTKTGQTTKLDLKGPIVITTTPDPKSKAKVDGSGKIAMKMDAKAL